MGLSAFRLFKLAGALLAPEPVLDAIVETGILAGSALTIALGATIVYIDCMTGD